MPLPAGARRLAYLDRVPLTDEEHALIDAMLTAEPARRLESTMRLVSQLRAALGPPDHEQPVA